MKVPKNRRLIILLSSLGLTLLISTISCEKETFNEDRLIGKWYVEYNTFFYYNGTELDNEETETYNEGEFTWEFFEDGTLIINEDGDEDNCDWEVLENYLLICEQPECFKLEIIKLTKDTLVVKMDYEYKDYDEIEEIIITVKSVLEFHLKKY